MFASLTFRAKCVSLQQMLEVFGGLARSRRAQCRWGVLSSYSLWTTRTATDDKSCIGRQERHHMTRVASDGEICIRRQGLGELIRVAIILWTSRKLLPETVIFKLSNAKKYFCFKDCSILFLLSLHLRSRCSLFSTWLKHIWLAYIRLPPNTSF